MLRGFTIIETVMVMVIIAILSVVLLLRWGASDKARIEGAVRKIASDIRYTQKLSISSQMRAGVIFNANGYSVYAVINATPPSLANSPGDPCSTDASGRFVVDFTLNRCSEYGNIAITPPTVNPIAFNSIGKLINSSGGDISSQTVSAGGKAVTVEAGTGRVSY